MHQLSRGSRVAPKRWAFAVAATVVAVGLVVATPAQAASPLPDNGLTSDYASDLAPQLVELTMGGGLLTNHGASHDAGTVIDLWQRTLSDGVTQPNQVWSFLSRSLDVKKTAFEAGEFGELRNLESGLCLTVPNSSTEPLTPVTQAPCSQTERPSFYTPWPVSSNQLWRAVPYGGGYAIVAAYAGLHLGFNRVQCASGFVNGDTVLTRDSEFGPCSKWTVRRVLPRGGTPVVFEAPGNQADLTGSGYALDSANPGSAAGVAAAMQRKVTPQLGTTQQWYRQAVGATYLTSLGWATTYRYVSVPGGDWSRAVCLGAHGGQPTLGAVVETYACDPNFASQPNQLWVELEGSDMTRIPSVDWDPGRSVVPNRGKTTLANLATADQHPIGQNLPGSQHGQHLRALQRSAADDRGAELDVVPRPDPGLDQAGGAAAFGRQRQRQRQRQRGRHGPGPGLLPVQLPRRRVARHHEPGAVGAAAPAAPRCSRGVTNADSRRGIEEPGATRLSSAGDCGQEADVVEGSPQRGRRDRPGLLRTHSQHLVQLGRVV